MKIAPSKLQKPQRSKKSKKTQRFQKLRKFLRLKPLLSTAFVLVFAGIGSVYLIKSRAAQIHYGSWCDNTWVDTPGGGLSYSANGESPTVAQASTPKGWQMVVVARGRDNAVWYTFMDSRSLEWLGSWRSLGGKTYATPKINATYIRPDYPYVAIYALGTDTNTYKNNYEPYSGGEGWRYASTGPDGYWNKLAPTTETPSNYVYKVRTNPDNRHVQYKCYSR